MSAQYRGTPDTHLPQPVGPAWVSPRYPQQYAPAPAPEYAPAAAQQYAPAPAQQYAPAPAQQYAPAPAQQYQPQARQYPPAPARQYPPPARQYPPAPARQYPPAGGPPSSPVSRQYPSAAPQYRPAGRQQAAARTAAPSRRESQAVSPVTGETQRVIRRGSQQRPADTSATQRLGRIVPPVAAVTEAARQFLPLRGAASSARTPLLLRGTIAVALGAAVLTSLVRAGAELPGMQHDALHVASATQTAAAVGASAGSTSRAAMAGMSMAGAAPKIAAATGRRSVPAAGAAVASQRPAVAGMVTTQGSACKVTYAVAPKAHHQFNVTVTLQNTDPTPVEGWVLRWAVPAGQRITYGYNAAFASGGTTATATDAGFDRQIPAGGHVTFGLTVGPTRPLPPATGFALNGVTCT
jgi:Cellulose binding domain